MCGSIFLCLICPPSHFHVPPPPFPCMLSTFPLPVQAGHVDMEPQRGGGVQKAFICHAPSLPHPPPCACPPHWCTPSPSLLLCPLPQPPPLCPLPQPPPLCPLPQP